MLKTLMFTPRIEYLLRRAGWTPDRRFNPAEWVTQLVQEGFRKNLSAVEILRSFGGIRIVWSSDEGISPVGGQIVFDPIEEASGYYEIVELWQSKLPTDIFPIGYYGKVGYVIWIGADEAIYYGRDYGLFKAGNDLPTAMENLVFGTDIDEVIPP